MFQHIYDVLEEAKTLTDTSASTNQNDTIVTGQENTTVFAKHGDDVIFSGAGDDILSGNTGDDIIDGNAGDDIIVGGVGEDTLRGGAGNDQLVASVDDKMVAGGNGFDTVYMRAEEGDDNFFDLVTQARSVEAIVGYGTEDVFANVSLSNILFQSQDDGNEETPDTDNTFIAVGLEGLSLEGIWRFLEDGELNFTSEDITGEQEQAYIEMLGLSYVPDGVLDLHAYTFGEGENAVTIVTDLSADDITVGNESLAEMSDMMPV
ncbi:calcium-binding protein [Vibrio sp. YMD68]|uniref:calcium-binding protein n=1 Tax=Vibrio sp. YMD68 TaxID=3042300 RepID=UPI00249C31F0|nr:calcium-binding protein [Vibrio sp. YMD68]WGV98441.1 calcium-binding protein [Vibrio sp. YMD68]